MARYKIIDNNPRFLAVDLSRQLLPGTFEHVLNHLLDRELDLSELDERYRNDETGAPRLSARFVESDLVCVFVRHRWRPAD